MGWRMKNFNIFGVQVLEGGFTKKQYIGGIAKKKGGEGLGQFVDLRGAWQERGGVFEGYVYIYNINVCHKATFKQLTGRQPCYQESYNNIVS